MIVRETTKAITDTTNPRDVAGARAVKEMVEGASENITLKPTTKVNVAGVLKNLSTYINSLTKVYVDETFSPNIIKSAWTATESSVYNTPLTNAVNVPAGTYIIIARTPFSELTTNAFFRISNVTGSGNTIYTGDNLFHCLVSGGSDIACIKFGSNQTGLALASGESTSLTWDNQYLGRGALVFIRIGS